jgi:hypothetical protein
MPKQESFFAESNGKLTVEVLKSYDSSYAQEVFRNMDDVALDRLWKILGPEKIYDPTGLPKLGDPSDVNGEAEAFLWDELQEQAREDGNLLSFFIVNRIEGVRTESIYVSPDWPSAEAFAKEQLVIEVNEH